MRRHLLQQVERLLVPLVALAGCQDTTDPQREAGGEESADLIPTISPAIAGKAGPPTHFRFLNEGAFGNVSWFAGPDASGNTVSGSLSISTSIEPATAANLSYSTFQCDASGSCTTLESGFGEIPASDFTVISKGFKIEELRLTTNTSNPDFPRIVGAGGPISVEWHETPGFRLRFTGFFEQREEGLRVTSHGTEVDHSATATGSVIGVQITGSQFTLIGEGHGRAMEIFH